MYEYIDEFVLHYTYYGCNYGVVSNLMSLAMQLPYTVRVSIRKQEWGILKPEILGGRGGFLATSTYVLRKMEVCIKIHAVYKSFKTKHDA